MLPIALSTTPLCIDPLLAKLRTTIYVTNIVLNVCHPVASVGPGQRSIPLCTVDNSITVGVLFSIRSTCVQLEVSPGVHTQIYRVHLPNLLPVQDLPVAFSLSDRNPRFYPFSPAHFPQVYPFFSWEVGGQRWEKLWEFTSVSWNHRSSD